MLNFLGCGAQGLAVASGVTTLALLERMVERNILTRADARAVLDSDHAWSRASTFPPSEAVHLMQDRMLPLFAERAEAQ